VQTLLRAPGYAASSRIHAALALTQCGCIHGPTSIVPSRFNRHATQMGVSAFGNGAATNAPAATVFGGHQPHVGYELARGLKAADVAKLADHSHGS
jgi:hypothetical protein